MPQSAPEAKAFEKGVDYNKMVAGLEEISKGMKPKVDPQAAAAAATISPMSSQPNQPSSLAHDLMNTLLAGRRNRGLTLTGG
jgi:hypothetical protein